MSISYRKLHLMLKERKISIYKLKTDKIIGTATMDKIRNNDGHIDTRSIENICRYLQCQPGDIIEYVDETIKRDNNASGSDNA